MTAADLRQVALRKRTLLCVALDPSPEVIPASVWQRGLDAVESYLQEVIRLTRDYAIAYKLNTAFYERWGEAGWGLLRRIRQALPSDTLAIADAKRGDIAYTNTAYAHAFWDELGFDAITVHPYLGWEPLSPFLYRAQKGVFVLLRTTEAPAWQAQVVEAILREKPQATPAWIGWVWGAHYSHELHFLRQIYPEDWLLVPGLGAQRAQIPKEAPLFPALLVVGRGILADPAQAPTWQQVSQSFLP
ncbi:MAG: orotidine-5'-phosphate decarboxylase [Bacteroidia bacterium]|nr:orotidine-5'-phosphate decarboxylase [Bacteroidia bacterium]MDW8235421.1 orotidine-5'-phosphate decarboxylase [Bacteroidia bacterium]